MPERKRSKDSTRETEKFVHDAPTPGQQGRADGNLKRKVGTRDELKRARRGDDATTRIRKSDKEDEA